MSTFTEDDPRHGTHAGAIQHHRRSIPMCGPCTDAEYVHNTRTKHRLNQGVRNRIPLGQRAWKVIDATTREQLSQACGIVPQMLSRMHADGPDRTVLRSTRDKILTAEPAYTVVGIGRRLQALAVLGYSGVEIGDAIGMASSNVVHVRRRKASFVRNDVALRIVAFYDTHHLTRSTRGRHSILTANIARRNGWHPPLAWDDIDWDAAPSTPPEKRVDNLAEYEHLRHGGVSHEQACETLGIQHDTITLLQRRRDREATEEAA